MARNSDYAEHVGSTDGAFALMAVDLGGGAFRLRWVDAETLGDQGPVGVSGSPGAANSTPGETGDKGETGEDGPVGPAGTDGLPGDSAAVLQPNIYLDDGLAVEYFEDYVDGQSSGLSAGRGWSGDWQISGGSVVTRTSHNGIIQKRLALTSGEIGRMMRFGDKWNKIQIGVLVRIDSIAALTAMNYYLGVCSGTSDMAGSATCANFIGQAGSAAGTITWATAAYNQQDTLVSSGTAAVTRRGNTNTLLGNPGALVIPTTEASLGMLWMEVNRAKFANNAASVTYTSRYRAVAAASANAGMSMMKEAFLNTIHGGLGSDPIVGSVDSSFASAFDQSTGALDTFNFVWNSAVPIEVAAVAVRKVW